VIETKSQFATRLYPTNPVGQGEMLLGLAGRNCLADNAPQWQSRQHFAMCTGKDSRRRGMRGRSHITLLAVVASIGVPTVASAQPPLTASASSSHLRESVAAHLAEVSAWPGSPTPATYAARTQQRTANRPGLLRRHPVLSGLVIGMAAGTAVAAATWGSEGAFVGFYSGAAAGATLGWMLSR
jgi:hypothetical protein